MCGQLMLGRRLCSYWWQLSGGGELVSVYCCAGYSRQTDMCLYLLCPLYPLYPGLYPLTIILSAILYPPAITGDDLFSHFQFDAHRLLISSA